MTILSFMLMILCVISATDAVVVKFKAELR